MTLAYPTAGSFVASKRREPDPGNAHAIASPVSGQVVDLVARRLYFYVHELPSRNPSFVARYSLPLGKAVGTYAQNDAIIETDLISSGARTTVTYRPVPAASRRRIFAGEKDDTRTPQLRYEARMTTPPFAVLGGFTFANSIPITRDVVDAPLLWGAVNNTAGFVAGGPAHWSTRYRVAFKFEGAGALFGYAACGSVRRVP
jgi:hypothetical protein